MLKVLKTLITASFLVASLAFAFQQEPVIAKVDSRVNTVVIDAGHGGKDPGTRGRTTKEKDVALAVALELGRQIKEETPNVKVLYTRSTDVFIELGERSAFANRNNADLFISIHCNALPDKTIRERIGTKKGKAVYKSTRVVDRSGKGVLMLVYGLKRTGEQQREIKSNQVSEEIDGEADPNDPVTIILTNEYLRRFRQKSITLANILADEFVTVDGRRLEGIREQSLNVLVHTAMPSVLVEIGYITNLEEEEYLNSEKGQEEIVATIVRSIQAYKLQVEKTVIKN